MNVNSREREKVSKESALGYSDVKRLKRQRGASKEYEEESRVESEAKERECGSSDLLLIQRKKVYCRGGNYQVYEMLLISPIRSEK